MMTRAAILCGGEYFKPEDAGVLLIWFLNELRSTPTSSTSGKPIKISKKYDSF